MRSISCSVLIARASASSGAASRASGQASNHAFGKVVGSPTIRSVAWVPRLSSSPTRPSVSSTAMSSARERGRPAGRSGRSRRRGGRRSSRPCAPRRRRRARGRSASGRLRGGRRPRRSPSSPRSSSGRGRCPAHGRPARRAPARPSALERARASRRRAASSPAHARRSRFPVPLLPRDHRVAQHADALDLGLHHVAGLQVERRRVGREPRDARHRPRREDVARRVPERRVVR